MRLLIPKIWKILKTSSSSINFLFLMSAVYLKLLLEFISKCFIYFERVNLELTNLDKEITHNLWRTVEDGAGQLNFLVTVTATTRGDSPSNLSNWEEELDQMKNNWINSYVRNSF